MVLEAQLTAAAEAHKAHRRCRARPQARRFEVRLAQGRARRARSLAQLRKHLHAPNGTALRYGLVGFYRAGDEAALKDRLKFPYPFAGWSLGREGSGFWCASFG